MAKKIGWAVMGMGLQGQKLAKAIEHASSAQLVTTASERMPNSFVAVLGNSNIDAVAIATPNNQHAAQVVAAARAGKNMLCEKPLALSLTEGKKIQQAVRHHTVRCFINFHLRMHPEVQRAKKILKEKKLGELSYIEMQWSVGTLGQKALPPLPKHMAWREDPKRAGGGALMARGVHLFDLLRFITGKEVTEVRAWSDATKNQVDRTAIGILILDKKTPATVMTSKVLPEANNHITLYGTKGKLVLREVFTADPQSLYTKVFEAFAEALKRKKTPLATLEDGIAAIKITEAFARSASGGRKVLL